MASEVTSIYRVAEVRKKMRKAVIFYVADAPEYNHLMDDLTQECTDAQWEKLCRMIDEADDFLADSDIGTLAQKERMFAKRACRPNRYPTVFDLDDVREKKIAALAKEYKAKGIPFRE